MTDKDPTHATTDDEPLANLSDEALGRRVRSTPTFRLAVACDHFADSAAELRDAEPKAWQQLITDTKREQSRVQSRETVEALVEAFLDSVEKYGELGRDPEEAARKAAEELADDGGDGGDA
jgi:hypothetical protein